MVHDDGNGGTTRLKLERRDLLGVFGAVVTALGVVVAVMMFVFQTKQESITQHGAIEQKIEIEKAVEVERLKHEDTRKQKVDDHLKKLDSIAQTTDTNVRRLLWSEGVKAKPLPAGLDVDLDDSP